MQIEYINTNTANNGRPLSTAWDGNIGQLAVPRNATVLGSNSAKAANAVATATLTGAASQTAYLKKAVLAIGGATAAATVDVTITGLLGGTMTIPVFVPADPNQVNVVQLDFGEGGWPASATNTAIVITIPALGAGNVSSSANAMGYRV